MTTFTVTTLTDENDADASVATPGGTGLSLREAIVLANASAGADDITFAAGLSGGTIRLTLGTLQPTTAALTINGDLGNDGTPNITITGDALNNDIHQSGSSILTDVDASLATAVGPGNALSDNVKLINSSQSLTLDGLILTGGYSIASGGGGAVRVVNGIPVTLTVTDSVVSGNGVDLGPGGGLAGSGAVIIDNTLISQNQTNQGGGGVFSLGAVTITDSTISFNSAGFSGGGVDVQNDLSVTNTTVSGNSASSFGGGLNASQTGSTLTVTNSTISGNSAGFGGGGVATTTNATMELVNSIVLGNSSEVSGSPTLTGGNIVGTNVFSGSTDIGNTSATQVFASVSGGAGVLADNGGSLPTIALKLDFTNPALDASNASAPATDVAGNARFDLPGVTNTNGGAADLGALEASEAGSLVVTTLTDVVNEFDGLTSLREAVAFANSKANANASTPDVITFDASLDGTIRLDGGDGAGGTVGGTLSITEAVTIDGDDRILITGDVNNDDTNAGATDISNVFSTAITELDDNVRIISASADLALDGLVLTGGVTSGDGGAVLGGIVTLTDSTLSGNSAARGGGIFTTSTATLTDSTVSANSAAIGGGIAALAATLTNSTVSGNSAVNLGGGISAATANLTNSTVSGNTAGANGGGLLATNAALTNSIILGNDASIGAEIADGTALTKTGGNIVGTDVFQGETDVGNTTAADVFAATVDIDPGADTVLAGVLADNGGPVQTIALKLDATNPGLDASNSSAPATDARGETRFDLAGVGNDDSNFADLGAYEAPELPSLVVTTLTDVVDDRDGLTSLREAVAFANGKANADASTPDVITFDASLDGTIRLDGGDGAGGTVGGTLSITEAVTIDGDGHILITGDVNNDDTNVGASDVTDIFATAGTELDDNVRIISATADLTLDGLVLTGGVTPGGGNGGAANSTASLTLTNSTVSGNNAIGGAAGGIFAVTANLVNSTVSGNSASLSGGGIAATNLALTNATVSGNIAAMLGGGISAVTATVTNSTISGNSANNAGGIVASSSVTLSNSIVLGNDAAINTEIFALNTMAKTGGNIVGTNVFQGETDVGDTTAADVFAATVDIDPGADVVLAGVLADNGGPVQTIALNDSLTNPALDAAGGSPPATDARGEARVDQPNIDDASGSPADLGAYELTTKVGVAIVGTKNADTINANNTPKGQPNPGDGSDIIFGRGGNDRIAGLGGDDIIIGGKGADVMRGGGGEDTFRFNSLAELRAADNPLQNVVGNFLQSAFSDHILDFVSGEDHLDFANMDADRTTLGSQDFTLIGSSPFSGTAGELRFVNKESGAVVSGDLNGDGKADFKLFLDHATVAASDFILV